MGKMKEAVMEITDYVMNNMEDFYAPEDIPLDDEMIDSVQNMVCEMDEETFFTTLMLVTPTRKQDYAV